MTTLLRFEHLGWQICTASWSAGSDNDRKTVVCYLWENGSGSTRVKFDMPFDAFTDIVSKGGVIDLRPYR